MKPTDIVNQQKFRQALLFEDLRDDPTNRKTGTDIDFEYEDGKVWIKAEVKQMGKKIPKGQKLLFERFADNIGNYTAVCFVLWHNVPPNEDIKIKDCLVAAYYWNGGTVREWHDTRDKKMTFKTAFEHFVNKYGKG